MVSPDPRGDRLLVDRLVVLRVRQERLEAGIILDGEPAGVKSLRGDNDPVGDV